MKHQVTYCTTVYTMCLFRCSLRILKCFSKALCCSTSGQPLCGKSQSVGEINRITAQYRLNPIEHETDMTLVLCDRKQIGIGLMTAQALSRIPCLSPRECDHMEHSVQVKNNLLCCVVSHMNSI